jgi:hypothetical protein
VSEPLRGRERYLDEVERPPPPQWRLFIGALLCLVPLALIVIGAKLLLFPDMSIANYAIRSLITGAGIAVLWIVFFRRRLGDQS